MHNRGFVLTSELLFTEKVLVIFELQTSMNAFFKVSAGWTLSGSIYKWKSMLNWENNSSFS